MASLRFATVRDLYDSFPTARGDVGAPPSAEPSLAFLESLITEESWTAAISFCSYLLPRREAVWWGCQSLRRIPPPPTAAETAAIEAAEAWVRHPEDDVRRAALDLGTRGNASLPATWMALAAGWSGGSIAPPEVGPVPAPPGQTARGVRAGLMIAMSRVSSPEVPNVMRPCIEGCIALAARSD